MASSSIGALISTETSLNSPVSREKLLSDFTTSLAPSARDALWERADRLLSRTKLYGYKPYPKQQEFHKAGAIHRERLFMSGNQLGKSLAGAMEWAMHLTGIYPEWWEGKRFSHPVKLWASGESTTFTRDNAQRLLVGPPERPEEWGTGTIPGDLIVGVPNRARNIVNALDSVVVRHRTGKASSLGFRTYDQGREKWAGETLHGVWFDEEPEIEIYTEGLTRTNATDGISIITFTPMRGLSEVVRIFLSDEQAKAMTI